MVKSLCIDRVNSLGATSSTEVVFGKGHLHAQRFQYQRIEER